MSTLENIAVHLTVLCIGIAIVHLTCVPNHPLYILDKQQRIIRQCDTPVLYLIAASVPIEHVDVIRRGFDHWNEVADAKLFIEVDNVSKWNLGDPETKAFTLVGVAESPDDLPPDACGITAYLQMNNDGCAIGTVVSINPRCVEHGPEILETIVRHEAGHVLSLKHSDIFTDLMYVAIEPTVQHPVDANESEIRAVRSLYLGKP